MMKNLIMDAESLMLHQFSHSKKLNGLVKSMVMPFQEALDTLERLHYGRYIDEAQGRTLDVIGDIVDFPRSGMSDEAYRIWLKVAILLNNGQGTARSIFDILQVLFGDKPKIQVDEYVPNVVMFTFFQYPDVPTKTLFSIIRRAVPLSTNCQFVDASPAKRAAEDRTNALGIREDSKLDLPTFQLDVTGFDESVFAEFFEEDR
jgi:hypothetical protein